MKDNISPVYFDIILAKLNQVYFDTSYLLPSIRAQVPFPSHENGVVCIVTMKPYNENEDVFIKVNNFEVRLRPDPLDGMTLKYINYPGQALKFDYAHEMVYLAIAAKLVQEVGFREIRYKDQDYGGTAFWDEVRKGEEFYLQLRQEVLQYYLAN